jgi:hypothetical protein
MSAGATGAKSRQSQHIQAVRSRPHHAKPADELRSLAVHEEQSCGIEPDPECYSSGIIDDVGYVREGFSLRSTLLADLINGVSLESFKISHDTLDIPTIFAVIQNEICSSLASKHLCFNSRTLENADFVLNPVRGRILTVRYSYMFSLHVLDALMRVKTISDFVQCIMLVLREFISFDSSHPYFFSHFLCDLIASRVLIKKDKTEMKSAMD